MGNSMYDVPDIGLVSQILNEIDESNMWDDALEHGIEDFIVRHELDEQTATLLFMNVQAKGYHLYRKDAPWTKEEFATMIEESEHHGHDGWSEGEKMVIDAFLYDIRRTLVQVALDKEREATQGSECNG